jgi:DNA-binding transcriptional regulator YiaG
MVTKQKVKRAATNRERPRHMTVAELRQALGLSRKLFARLTGFSERAIADWEAGKKLSEATRQRMSEMQRLQQGLARVMRREFIGEWLQTPNEALAGLKPIEAVERGEIDRLWRMIYMLESGQPS